MDLMADDEKLYKLIKPVSMGKDGATGQNKIITEVLIKEPTMGQLKGINLDAIGLEQWTELFGKISDQPTIVFDRMKPVDGYAVVDIMSDFLAGGPQTGETSAES